MSSSHLKPLVTHLYTADPSAHVFNNRIYVYPSHDRDTGIADNDNGDQYEYVHPIPHLSPTTKLPATS